MAKQKYTVTVRVEDVDDPEFYAEATFERCPRENVIDLPILGNVVKSFEKMDGDEFH